MLGNFKKLITNNKGMVLITLLLFSMMLLSLGLTMLYQSDSNYKLSALVRDKTETFMVAETAYESSINRMIYYMDKMGFEDNFRTAQPGVSDGWPNYLLRVYDDPKNPTHFRLVEQPTKDFYDNATDNRDVSSAVEVTDDNINPVSYLITRQDSISAGDVFKVDDKHFYRAWLETDRYLDQSSVDRTAFLMIEAFRGVPTASVDPGSAGFLPQTHVLMQYRIKLVKTISIYETGDVSQYGEGSAGTGATYSGGEIDISETGGSRTITEED